MGQTFFFPWEMDLIEFLQSHMNDFMIDLASYISAFGEELCMVFVLGFTYWVWNKETGVKIGMNILVTDVIFPLVKNIALRRRPYMDNPNIHCLKAVDKEADIMDLTAQGYSFPSGHSANSATAFSSIAFYIRRKIFTILAILIPLLVGISRFCLGVHFPTDVIAGWAIGYAVVFLMPLLEKKFKDTRKMYYAIFFVFLLGVIFVRSNDYYTSLGMMLGLLLGVDFEKKYVNFKNTRNILAIILRLLGGFITFIALNFLLKLPFSETFLSQASFLQFTVRFIRYGIILFVESAIYPTLFGKIVKEK